MGDYSDLLNYNFNEIGLYAKLEDNEYGIYKKQGDELIYIAEDELIALAYYHGIMAKIDNII